MTVSRPNRLVVFIRPNDIKPGILKKAIRIAHKSEFGRTQDDHALLEQILTQVGKTLLIL
jgi:hypothetical protein